MIIESGTKDIIYTPAISGVNANFMRKSLEANGITEELWNQTGKINFGSDLNAAEAEAKAWKTVWSAGQGVATIEDVQPVQTLVRQLKEEFRQAIANQQQLAETFI